MWLKILIIITLIGVIVSLASGLVFLMKDKGKTNRVANSLFIRVVLAAILFGLIVYGFWSGILVTHAPWLT